MRKTATASWLRLERKDQPAIWIEHEIPTDFYGSRSQAITAAEGNQAARSQERDPTQRARLDCALRSAEGRVLKNAGRKPGLDHNENWVIATPMNRHRSERGDPSSGKIRREIAARMAHTYLPSKGDR